MGPNETPSKSEKSSSVISEHPVARSYPDWGSMQAFYGPGVPIPTPYFGATAAPGHTPYPYMWSPQPILTPFGGAYTAIYPHGIYSHPSSANMAALLNPEFSAKPPIVRERRITKKIKGIDGIVTSTSIPDPRATSHENGSHSYDNEAEDSCAGTDGSSESDGSEKQRNRCSEDLANSGGKNLEGAANAISGATTDVLPIISLGMSTASGHVTPTPGPDLRACSFSKQNSAGELAVMQDERTLKREKRKQSNRESARRSRLRKQAETEELAIKVGSLTAENTALRSEITRLIESSDKVLKENSVLMEKLKMAQLRKKQEEIMPSSGRPYEEEEEEEEEAPPSLMIENLLSKMEEEEEASVTTAATSEENSGDNKLHQLLDSSNHPRTDPVAAS